MKKDKRQCIIHYAVCDKEEEHLVSPKDNSSWLALLEESVDEESNPTKRQCRKPSSEGRVYDPVCIFCSKVKFMKSPKTREKLIQAVQLRADATLCHCAILNNDARILAITSRDIVAAEAHYHASCYKNYTNIKTKQGDHVGDKEVENSSQVTDMLSYEVAEVEAYV